MRLTIFLLVLLLVSSCTSDTPPQPVSHVLAEDGAWCWFQDPRAVYFEGTHRRTYSGWVTKAGQLRIGTYDHDTEEKAQITLREEWGINDHNTPSFLVLPDGRLTVFYARHNGKGLYSRTTTQPENISSWEEEVTVTDTDRITYNHPVQLSEEDNRFYVFWRGPSWKPTFASSEDGQSWTTPQILVQQPGREEDDIRPYLKLVSDGKSSIHFAFTNGHPRNEDFNSVYYIRYQDGEFYRADGSRIGTMEDLPIDHAESDLVYDASLTKARAWIWDIALDENGFPVIAYTRLPEETDHRYHYARWDGDQWRDYEIAEAGSWFPQTPDGEEEREVHYSGGIALNHTNPSVLYFSQQDGNGFQIKKGVTADGGQNWTLSSITQNQDTLNVRPVVPRGYDGDGDHLLWMQGPYRHYTDYETAIHLQAVR